MTANETAPRLGNRGAAQTDVTSVSMSTILPHGAIIPREARGVPLARSARSFFEGQAALRRILTERDDLMQQVGRRLVIDMIGRLTASQWEHRAEVLEDAMSRPADYLGRSTAAERAARDARLADDAARCRRHAALLRSIHADEAVAS